MVHNLSCECLKNKEEGLRCWRCVSMQSWFGEAYGLVWEKIPDAAKGLLSDRISNLLRDSGLGWGGASVANGDGTRR